MEKGTDYLDFVFAYRIVVALALALLIVIPSLVSSCRSAAQTKAARNGSEGCGSAVMTGFSNRFHARGRVWTFPATAPSPGSRFYSPAFRGRMSSSGVVVDSAYFDGELFYELYDTTSDQRNGLDTVLASAIC